MLVLGRAVAVAVAADPATNAGAELGVDVGLAVGVEVAADMGVEVAVEIAVEVALGVAEEVAAGEAVGDGVGVGVGMAVTAGSWPATVVLSSFWARRPISESVAAKQAMAMTAATTQRALLPLLFPFSALFSPLSPPGVAGPSGLDTVTPPPRLSEQLSTLVPDSDGNYVTLARISPVPAICADQAPAP
ncbi:MAG TPA: hypothetical protein VMZ00_11855 [Sporichthya sp.]|nr:hypothetical protein [Sporichthya sp.]